MTRRRAGALGVLLAALVAYGALAEQLPELPSRGALAVVALLVLPAFFATVWLALPLVNIRRPHLLIAAAGLAALLWVGLELADVDSASNVAKFSAFALAGLWFVTLFEELWWVALVAVIVPWMDVWSVAFGPTRYVVEEQPGFFEEISVAFALPGEAGSVNLGPPDVIFFALFLAAAARFDLRVDVDLDRDDRLPRAHARSRVGVGGLRPARATRRLPGLPRGERGPALAQRT